VQVSAPVHATAERDAVNLPACMLRQQACCTKRQAPSPVRFAPARALM